MGSDPLSNNSQLETSLLYPHIFQALEQSVHLRVLSDELRAADFEARRGTTELALVESRFACTESYHEIAIPRGAVEGELVPVVIGESSVARSFGLD